MLGHIGGKHRVGKYFVDCYYGNNNRFQGIHVIKEDVTASGQIRVSENFEPLTGKALPEELRPIIMNLGKGNTRAEWCKVDHLTIKQEKQIEEKKRDVRSHNANFPIIDVKQPDAVNEMKKRARLNIPDFTNSRHLKRNLLSNTAEQELP